MTNLLRNPSQTRVSDTEAFGAWLDDLDRRIGVLERLKIASEGGASDLDALTDVTLSSPSNGQALLYDSASGQWKNAAAPLVLPAGSSLVLDPAKAGPRSDDATAARFGNKDASDYWGLMAYPNGGLDAIVANAQGFAVWGSDGAGGFTRRLHCPGLGTVFGEYMEIGKTPHHGDYASLMRYGGGPGDYALLQGPDFSTLINGRNSIGFRLNNGADRITINGNDNIFSSGPGWTYIKQGSTDRIVVEVSQIRSYNLWNHNGRLAVFQSPNGYWDGACVTVDSAGNSVCLMALHCSTNASQLRIQTAEGDMITTVSYNSGAYTALGASAFTVKSSLRDKTAVRDVRSLGPERERIVVRHDPMADLVPDLDVMALRPVAFRPAVEGTQIDGEPWPADHPFGVLEHRERLGLIAEEVATVIPSAVRPYEDGSAWGIDYAQVTVALLAHVQRLTDEVATLRYRVAELEGAA